ncbi:hypothetical protein D9M72_178020 [compost metagenome]
MRPAFTSACVNEEPTPSATKLTPSVEYMTRPCVVTEVIVYCSCVSVLSGSKALSMPGVIWPRPPSATVSGWLAVPGGSGCVGSGAITGASLTLVIWMPTVTGFDAAPQRSTACTLNWVVRTSEPSLTKRRPVVPALPVMSEASMRCPTATATQAAPFQYSSWPPVGRLSNSNCIAPGPLPALLKA